MSNDAYPPGPIKQYRSEGRGTVSVPRRFSHQSVLVLCSALVMVFLFIAWHVPIAAFLQRAMGPRIPSPPRTSYTFAALAYGPVGGDNGIPLDRIEEHIDALKAGGFFPISIQDAHDLLHAGVPVPERAVLMTFDLPRSRSWSALTRLIRSTGWRAAVFVSGSAHVDGESRPSWRALRMAVGERRWEVGSMGTQGHQSIQISQDGSEGAFFSNLEWLDPLERIETIHEYRDRILTDLRYGLDLIEDRLGARPLSFAYPNGSFGQDGPYDPLRNMIRLGLVARHFDLAFISGPLAHNGQEHDPMRLNRLQVDPEWTGNEVVAQLVARAGYRPMQRADDGRWVPDHWIMDRNHVAYPSAMMHMWAETAQGPSRIWVAGSRHHADGVVAMRFRPEDGIIHWWLRATPDGADGLNMQWGPDGVIRLFSLREGKSHLLASSYFPRQAGSEYRWRIVLRNQILQALVDGERIFPQPIRIPRAPAFGFVGTGVEPDTAGGVASARLSAFTMEPAAERVASWDPSFLSIPQSIESLHQYADHYTIFSPPLNQIDNANDPEGTARDTFGLLAHWYGARFMPSVEIDAAQDLFRHVPPERWAKQLAISGGDGVYLRFTGSDAVRLGDLSAWLRIVDEEVRQAGGEVLLKVPESLEQTEPVELLSRALPNVQLATSAAVARRIEADIPSWVLDEPLAQPVPPERSMYYELHPDPERDARQAQERRIEQMAAEAHAAMRLQRYEDAIAFYSDWHSADPKDPAPLNYIADALLLMNFRDEAVEFLVQSLDIDPGQIERFTQLVDFLEHLGRPDEARLWLNRYTLLFPDNTTVQLALTQWLLGQDRRAEARTRARQILADAPDHLPTALLLLRIAERSDERQAALRTILTVGRQPAHHAGLVEATRAFDLLTLPDTQRLYDLLNHIEQKTEDAGLRAEIRRLRPRNITLSESYTGQPLSSAWHLDGALARPESGGVVLQAKPDRRAYSMHLLGSQGWRDAFIEVTVQPGSGSFWLNARRAHEHMMRLGYNERDGRLRLQWWETRNNQKVILSDHATEWQPDGSSVTLRLEARGKGAMAYVNGVAAFPSPLSLPGDMGEGRVSLDGEADEPGTARLLLRDVSAGPLAAGIARLRPDDGFSETTMSRLQSVRHLLTDISPEWFACDAEGSWMSRPAADDDLYRLFARYHGFRFMPIARVARVDRITPGELRTLIEIHELDGLILLCPALPDHEWLAQLEQRPEARGLSLVFMQTGAPGEDRGRIYGMGPARALNQHTHAPVELQRKQWDDIHEQTDRPPVHTLIDLAPVDDAVHSEREAGPGSEENSADQSTPDSKI